MKEAIILAGGMGTRLRDVVPDLPKAMALVAGRPFLEIVLRNLSDKGFSRVVLSLGFMSEKIVSHFGSNFAGMELVYVLEDVPLGTGGGARLALTQCSQDKVFVLNGDTFIDFEAAAIERSWSTRRNPIIVAHEVANASRYGCLLVRDGRVIGFTEKGVLGQGIISAGCYVFSRGQLDAFPLRKPFSLETDFLANAAEKIAMDVFVSNGFFIDIGVPEDYLRAQSELSFK